MEVKEFLYNKYGNNNSLLNTLLAVLENKKEIKVLLNECNNNSNNKLNEKEFKEKIINLINELFLNDFMNFLGNKNEVLNLETLINFLNVDNWNNFENYKNFFDKNYKNIDNNNNIIDIFDKELDKKINKHKLQEDIKNTLNSTKNIEKDFYTYTNKFYAVTGVESLLTSISKKFDKKTEGTTFNENLMYTIRIKINNNNCKLLLYLNIIGYNNIIDKTKKTLKEHVKKIVSNCPDYMISEKSIKFFAGLIDKLFKVGVYKNFLPSKSFMKLNIIMRETINEYFSNKFEIQHKNLNLLKKIKLPLENKYVDVVFLNTPSIFEIIANLETNRYNMFKENLPFYDNKQNIFIFAGKFSKKFINVPFSQNQEKLKKEYFTNNVEKIIELLENKNELNENEIKEIKQIFGNKKIINEKVKSLIEKLKKYLLNIHHIKEYNNIKGIEKNRELAINIINLIEKEIMDNIKIFLKENEIYYYENIVIDKLIIFVKEMLENNYLKNVQLNENIILYNLLEVDKYVEKAWNRKGKNE